MAPLSAMTDSPKRLGVDTVPPPSGEDDDAYGSDPGRGYIGVADEGEDGVEGLDGGLFGGVFAAPALLLRQQQHRWREGEHCCRDHRGRTAVLRRC